MRTMDLKKLLNWAKELATTARQDGLHGFTRRLLHGLEFLRLVDDAAQPRIIEKSRGRAGTIKVDTGLPDLGAKRFFEGLSTPTGVAFAGIGGAFSLFIGIRGLFDFFVSIATEHPPVLAMLVIFAFVVALILLGTVGVVWALRNLLLASVKATSTLTADDCAQLAELLHKNADVVKKDGVASCNDYRQLAQFIVHLRHEIADKDILRAI